MFCEYRILAEIFRDLKLTRSMFLPDFSKRDERCLFDWLKKILLVFSLVKSTKDITSISLNSSHKENIQTQTLMCGITGYQYQQKVFTKCFNFQFTCKFKNLFVAEVDYFTLLRWCHSFVSYSIKVHKTDQKQLKL